MRRLVLVVFFCLLIVPVAAEDETIIIQPDEQGILSNLLTGEISVLTPGIHTYDATSSEVTIYYMGQQAVYLTTDMPTDENPGDAIAAYTLDGQQVYVDLIVIFNIDEIEPIHVRWQNRYIDEYVSPVAGVVTHEVIARDTADELYGEFRQEADAVLTELIAADFEKEGLYVTDVLIRDLTFSEEYLNAIEVEYQLEAEIMMAGTRIQAEIAVLETYIDMIISIISKSQLPDLSGK